MEIKETFDNDKNLENLIEEYLKMMLFIEKESKDSKCITM